MSAHECTNGERRVISTRRCNFAHVSYIRAVALFSRTDPWYRPARRSAKDARAAVRSTDTSTVRRVSVAEKARGHAHGCAAARPNSRLGNLRTRPDSEPVRRGLLNARGVRPACDRRFAGPATLWRPDCLPASSISRRQSNAECAEADRLIRANIAKPHAAAKDSGTIGRDSRHTHAIAAATDTVATGTRHRFSNFRDRG